ncbi:MAG: DMT family transporter [Octadecabacter sp.]|jgi:drug/metabolite transporter (DMT)-like permease|nr:DMT family transporter [Octadecabacter sp.]MDC1216013.1 DMT family transporter [Octadecabacter sp.]MDC1228960.1 DMT family transporter [Octadecabacter sp.]MDC1297253.1 DMT family transporter [Octadecabacter sp.]MDC1380993.1 DMT family transporter [Octadecabacter sp.]|tara:strand:+ start:3919 stop:4848 length:930 start_codon:yes stop_codon:yes gene_type:complete
MTTATQTNVTRGIFLMLSAITVFTLMSAFIKAAGRVPAGEAMFFRSIMAMPIVLIWLVTHGGIAAGIKTTSVRNHAVRGIVGSCAMGLGFAGLKYLPLPEVTAIRFVTPILMVVLAALILGERFRFVRIAAVMLGFVGVIIIVAPRLSVGLGSTEALGVLLTLGSACLAAFAQVFVKGMAGKESTTAIVFWFSATSTLLSLVTIPFGWVWPNGYELTLLIGAGIVGGLGQVLLTSSYRFAEAGVLAPFTYVSILWSVLIGYVWFSEVPTLGMLVGAALVICAGVIIVLRERALGMDATARRKVKAKGLQ